MNENAPNRSDERIITPQDRATFWLGRGADELQCVIDAYAKPAPLLVIDTTEVDE
jgi:hypothetical protein